MNPLSFISSSVSRIDSPAQRPGESAPPAPRPVPRQADQVDFSSSIRLSTDDSDQPVRLDLVRRVRDQLAADAYETTDKLDIATERAVQDLDILA